MHSEKPIIPIFFAVDDNYAPYLAVAMRSLIDNASPEYQYNIHILIDKLNEYNTAVLCGMATANVSVELVNVSQKLDTLNDKLHLRDYYTKATYYRFFIPDLFPQYNRGIYLDCDITVVGDISELYNCPLGEHILAAVNDDVVSGIDLFAEYAERVLNIPRDQYFNAGILVMNLKKMRQIDLKNAFVELLSRRTFRVAQDQDYLNVLCFGNVLLLSDRWNRDATPDACEQQLGIAHFKINFKPWRYHGIRFEQHFWKYADQTPYKDTLYAMREYYSAEEIARDQAQYEHLMMLATEEIKNAKKLVEVT